MGADLITYCVVHPDGPLTKKERRAAINYLKKLHREAARYIAKGEGTCLGNYDLLGPVATWLVKSDEVEHDCLVSPEFEAARLVFGKTEEPEQLVDALFEWCRDMSSRVWRGHHIYYAGELSWGNEPEGYGYQSLKWLELLGVFPYLGLE